MRKCCFRFSTLVFAAGLQCYAYAGFAVNVGGDEPQAIYESATALVPKTVSKDQALEFYAKHPDKYQVLFAYDVSHGKDLHLEDASALDAFCINPYTFKIAVATKTKDCLALTQARPQVFYVIEGESLSETIARWSKEQGYQSRWMAPSDFKIQFSYAFYASFPEALNELLNSISSSADGFAVRAEITPNKVVLIKPNEYIPKPVVGL